MVKISDAVGIIASILGVFFVRTGEKGDPGKALNNGTVSSAVFYTIGSFFLVVVMFGWDLSYFKAAVVGDTVGDPFKDTSAPSMNILLKLMTVVSLVFGPMILIIHKWLISLF
jgi:Na+/H+-translocating membrane pyrophosphatase